MLNEKIKEVFYLLEYVLVKPYFDKKFYVESNKDVAASNLSPIFHYLKFGDLENRSPLNGFNCSQYRAMNGRLLGLSSLTHAVIFNKSNLKEKKSEFVSSNEIVKPIGRIKKLDLFDQVKTDEICKNNFDVEFYRSMYPDVKGSDLDIFQHYMNYGWKENRHPNHWFNPTYYTFQNPELSDKTNPFIHYLLKGRARAHPQRQIHNQETYLNYYISNKNYFDTLIYAESLTNAGIKIPKNPSLKHFINVGSRLGLRASEHFDLAKVKSPGPQYIENHFANFNYSKPLIKGNRIAKKKYTIEHKSDHEVSVVIPVYDGLIQTKKMLASVLNSKNNTKYKIIIIYDNGPDPQILEFLVGQSKAFPHRIDLHVQSENVGFVKTMNNGFFKHTDNDVIILNADTEVSDHWVDRMLWHANFHHKVATITPFTNNGTICNFPSLSGFSADNNTLNVKELSDAAHSENAGISIQIPTGVGFCMYISRESLSAIGGFDEEAFGLGYGEENDFCRRAEKNGFVNLHALDLFVYHEGGVSFETQNVDKAAHEQALISKNPEYNSEVTYAYRLDWARPYRLRSLLHFLNKCSEPISVFLSHNLGGGTEKLIQKNLQQNNVNIIISQNENSFEININLKNNVIKVELTYNEFIRLVETLSVVNLELHHTIGWDDNLLYYVLKCWPNYKVFIHDFHWVCGRIYGVTNTGINCGVEEDARKCDECISSDLMSAWSPDPELLRYRSFQLLSKAEQVVCSGNYIQDKLERILKLDNVIVDDSFWLHSTAKPHSKRENLNSGYKKIIILGTLSEHKGLTLVRDSIPFFDASQIKVVHIGNVVGKPLGIKSSGYYDSGHLKDLIEEEKPDLIWIPSIAEETFSFVLSEALETKYPILVNDVGIMSERALKNKAVYVLEKNISPEKILHAINGFSHAK